MQVGTKDLLEFRGEDKVFSLLQSLNDDENRDDNEARDEPNEMNPDDPGVESVGNEPVNVVPELPLIGRRQRKKVKRYGFD